MKPQGARVGVLSCYATVVTVGRVKERRNESMSDTPRRSRRLNPSSSPETSPPPPPGGAGAFGEGGTGGGGSARPSPVPGGRRRQESFTTPLARSASLVSSADSAGSPRDSNPAGGLTRLKDKAAGAWARWGVGADKGARVLLLVLFWYSGSLQQLAGHENIAKVRGLLLCCGWWYWWWWWWWWCCCCCCCCCWRCCSDCFSCCCCSCC